MIMKMTNDLIFFKTYEYVTLCNPNTLLTTNLKYLKEFLTPIRLTEFSNSKDSEKDWEYVYNYFERKAIYDFLKETFTDGNMLMKDVKTYMENYLKCWYANYI